MFSSKYRVLAVFFTDPYPQGGFGLREISREASLAPASTKQYLQELQQEQLVRAVTNRRGQPKYVASENKQFRFLKKQHTIRVLQEAIPTLVDSTLPDCIILFGSAARGEDTRESDVDLYIQSRQQDISLFSYEKLLKRKISVLFSDSFNNLSQELKNNLVNGVVLYGYLEAFP